MWQAIVNNYDFILVVILGLVLLFALGMIVIIGCHVVEELNRKK